MPLPLPGIIARLAPHRRWVAAWLGIALGFALLAWLGLLNALPGMTALALWPTVGLGLALALAFGLRTLPGLAAGVVLAAYPVARDAAGLGPAASLALTAALAAGQVLVVAVAHTALRRQCPSWPFSRLREAGLYVTVALGVAFLAAALGCATLVASGLTPLHQAPADFIAWWLSQSSAMLLFVPALLGFITSDRPRLLPARLAELATVLGLLAAVCVALMSGGSSALGGAAGILPLPFLVWCAFRFGAWGAALSTTLAGILGIVGSQYGVGLFGTGTPTDVALGHLLAMDLAGTTVLLMAALVSELKNAEASLRAVNETLEARVEERTANLIESNLVLTREVADRRRAEDALRESEARFRDLVDHLPQTVFEFDLNGRFTFLNATATVMFGFTPENLARGLQVLDLVHPEDRERTRENIGRQMAGAGLQGGEYRCLHKDGRVVPARIYSHVITREGRPVGIRGIVFDVSDIKRAERELAEKEEKFRTLVEMLPLALVIFQDGVVVFANPAAAETSGYPSPDVMLGLNAFEQFAPEERPRIEDLARRRMGGEQGLPSRYEARMLKADGRPFHAELSVRIIEFNGRPAHQVLCADVSERKAAESRIRDSEFFLRETQRLARLGGWKANPYTGYLFWTDEVNHIIEMPVGYKPQLEEGLRFYAPEYLPHVKEMLTKVMEDGTPRSLECEIITGQGNRIWAELHAVTRQEEGSAPVAVGTIQDITERKKAEAELLQAQAGLEHQVASRTRELTEANQQLRELNAQMSAFLSSASHELRTPLTSILGFARMIQKLYIRHFADAALSDPVLSRKGQMILEDAGIIVMEGERLSRLVGDLLDLNKIESGRMQWRDEDLDLVELLGHTFAAVSGAFAARPELELRTAVPAKLPRVRADRDRVEQVVMNLLHNALKFTPAGTVDLAARAVDDAVEIRVMDTGPGVPEAERGLIFQKFYQMIDGDRDRSKPKGTGLGLAICQQIVEHYGGQIWSEPGPKGRGACFAFRLPALAWDRADAG
jgi:PAS domain S-box-containing protein